MIHDDMPGGVPQLPKEHVVMRHFDEPVSVRQLLHSALDRLFDYMIAANEGAGVVAITPLDVPEFDGGSIVLALDLMPDAHEYDGLSEDA